MHKVKSKEIANKTIDTAVSLLDALMAQFTIGLPVVNIIKGFVLVGNNVYNLQLVKKILELLENVDLKDEKTKKKIEEFFARRIEGAKYYQTNGELLIEVIDHTDDVRKAGLIGKMLSYCLKNAINKDDFFKATYIVSRSYYNDLDALLLFVDQTQCVSSKDERLDLLFTYGFIDNCGIDDGDASGNGGIIYALNKYGKIVLNVLKG